MNLSLNLGMFLCTVSLVALAAGNVQLGGGKIGGVTAPEIVAKRRAISNGIDEAKGLLKSGQSEQALAKLRVLSLKEDEVYGHSSSAKYELAKALTTLNRPSEALDAYRRGLKWDSISSELTINGPVANRYVSDYAVLLAKSGQLVEAKELYYYLLRSFNREGYRNMEAVPFTVVFDEEPGGVHWALSADKLEAAILMLQVLYHGGSSVQDNKNLWNRVRQLTPTWFYPLMERAASRWNQEDGASRLAEAESLAESGLDREFVAKYKQELVEHKARLASDENAPYHDQRPMADGAHRRAQMSCLKPNQEVLRRISVGWPAVL